VAYRFPYTPTCGSVFSNFPSHRSGRHSYASAPHTSRFLYGHQMSEHKEMIVPGDSPQVVPKLRDRNHCSLRDLELSVHLPRHTNYWLGKWDDVIAPRNAYDLDRWWMDSQRFLHDGISHQWGNHRECDEPSQRQQGRACCRSHWHRTLHHLSL
jgi:hypothetical protein